MSRDIGERDPRGRLCGRGNRSRPQARRSKAACNPCHSGAAERPPQARAEPAPAGGYPPRTPRHARALHDASPRGCALPLHLADAGARVVDAGLRPAWVDRDDIQVLEGAPAHLPRDLSSLLADDETDWLRSGRRVELAVLPPERLLHLVNDGVDRARAVSSANATPAGVADTLPSLP